MDPLFFLGEKPSVQKTALLEEKQAQKEKKDKNYSQPKKVNNSIQKNPSPQNFGVFSMDKIPFQKMAKERPRKMTLELPYYGQAVFDIQDIVAGPHGKVTIQGSPKNQKGFLWLTNKRMTKLPQVRLGI